MCLGFYNIFSSYILKQNLMFDIVLLVIEYFNRFYWIQRFFNRNQLYRRIRLINIILFSR